ncbi:MAG: hypothetical protein B7Y37_00415 [Sphingobacteriia bacterium 28-36-52]|nr:MAG: hypothetical protein B7Y37_00415 [Sphingobacteriia bacterium 28-36-52]
MQIFFCKINSFTAYPLKYRGLVVGQPLPLTDAQELRSTLVKTATKMMKLIFFIRWALCWKLYFAVKQRY